MDARGAHKMPQNYVKLIVTNNVIELMEYEKLNVKTKFPTLLTLLKRTRSS